MEFHYARHEKISLRCPLEALIASTCAKPEMKSRGGSYFMSVIFTAMRFISGVKCKQADMACCCIYA